MKDFQGLIILAGANSMITGGYLTTRGRSMSDDAYLLSSWEDFDFGSPSCRQSKFLSKCMKASISCPEGAFADKCRCEDMGIAPSDSCSIELMRLDEVRDFLVCGSCCTRQISNMWASGTLTGNMKFVEEGKENWQPLSVLQQQLESESSTATSSPLVSTTKNSNSLPEKSLWEGHPSFWLYEGAISAGIVIILIGVLLIGMHFIEIPLLGIPLLEIPLIVAMSLILLSFLYLLCYLSWKRQKYIVTNKRVKSEYGIFVTSSNEVRICDVRSVNLRRAGLAGLMGIGSLDFSSAAGSGVEVSFSSIGNAEKIKTLVDSLRK